MKTMKLVKMIGVMAAVMAMGGTASAKKNIFAKAADAMKIESCHVKVKITNSCGYAVKIFDVNLWHKRDKAQFKLPIPSMGDEVKSGKTKTYDYHLLVACSAKRKAEVLFHNLFSGQGRLLSNTKRTTEWISGKSVELKLKSCAS